MSKKYLLFLALCLFVNGCAPVDSLNPLFTDKDVIFDSSLLGDWVSPDPTEKGMTRIVEYDERGRKIELHPPATPGFVHGYNITLIDDDGSRTELRAQLVDLKGHHFLDAVIQTWDASSQSYALHLNQSNRESKLEPGLLRLGMAAYMEFSGPNTGKIEARLRPAHWFFKVTVDGKKMRLDYIDDGKLMKAIAQDGIRIRHSLLGQGKDKDIVLTAGTTELQRFVLEHVNDGKVFTDHTDLQRRP
jgi:hypothetical protein